MLAKIASAILYPIAQCDADSFQTLNAVVFINALCASLVVYLVQNNN
jgi:hypothetical protein